MTATILSSHRETPPYGLKGGLPGKTGENSVVRAEGEVINLRSKDQPVFVRVKHISRYSYTLALNAAELSVKY